MEYEPNPDGDPIVTARNISKFEASVKEEVPEYIDMTPTWRGIMPGLLDAWSNVIPENERIMREEFQRVAVAADRYNLISKAYRDMHESEDPTAFAEALYAILHGRV